jgi:hypothetical protein
VRVRAALSHAVERQARRRAGQPHTRRRAHRLISTDGGGADGGGEQHEAQNASHGSRSIRRAIVDPASRAAASDMLRCWLLLFARRRRGASRRRVLLRARVWVMKGHPSERLAHSAADRPHAIMRESGLVKAQSHGGASGTVAGAVGTAAAAVRSRLSR